MYFSCFVLVGLIAYLARAVIEIARPHSMARVYADVNANMPRAYWDYDSVNISWGVQENYEVVRKIGESSIAFPHCLYTTPHAFCESYNFWLQTRDRSLISS